MANVAQLNNIYNSNLMIADELTFLRDEVKKGLSNVQKATESLNPETAKADKPGAWRDVPRYSEAEQYPLVRNDVETLIKKLDII